MRSDSSEASGQLPHVALLILNWNGARDTIECLESVFRLEYPRFTVVLCDNASSDGSADAIVEWACGVRNAAGDTPPELRHLVEPPVPKPVPLVQYSRAEAERGSPMPDAGLVLIHNGENL